MARIVMTEQKLRDDLKTLARGKSSYDNEHYPKNVLYWDGERFWADCVNLYKSLFNGRDITDKTVGSYQRDLSNTGDVTEWGLLSQCDNISTDFSTLGNKFECLYKDGHFGGYLGEEWNEPGQGIVNCVEATPAWEDGIQFSYVDSNGNRAWCKGGSSAPKWTHHGIPTKFIDYSGTVTTETQAQTVTPAAAAEKLTANALAQAIMNGGIVSGIQVGNGQNRINNLKSLGYTEDEIKAAQTIINDTLTEKVEQQVTIAINESRVNMAQTMKVIEENETGETVKILQQVLAELGYYNGNIDGQAGPITIKAIKAIQTDWHNTDNSVAIDGSFGPQSWSKLLEVM